MKIYVGHDSREDIAYQVCEHSIKRRDPSAEVIPLKQKQMRARMLKRKIPQRNVMTLMAIFMLLTVIML